LSLYDEGLKFSVVIKIVYMIQTISCLYANDGLIRLNKFVS
jgi:hypothetical protein